MEYAVLHLVDHRAAIAGKQFDFVFRGLVGAQQAVVFVVAASVHGGGQYLVQAYRQPGSGLLQEAAGAETRMNVAVDNRIGVLEDNFGPVGEYELHLGALRTHKLGIILHIIYAGEFVQVDPEQLAVAL